MNDYEETQIHPTIEQMVINGANRRAREVDALESWRGDLPRFNDTRPDDTSDDDDPTARDDEATSDERTESIATAQIARGDDLCRRDALRPLTPNQEAWQGKKRPVRRTLDRS